ncbi:placenta-specific gene 8 protein-like [Montipora foliosa]|uniref:placenta-specific gene 8 protein-like n=1 Tax=Montipora foliosa TaxID=591990 RepID=UPI0035F1990B
MSVNASPAHTTTQTGPNDTGPPPYAPLQTASPPHQYGYPPPQYDYPPPITTQPGIAGTHTTIVVNQPAPLTLQRGLRNWNSGLCGCCDDCYSCAMGAFCPLCLLCQVSERMGEGCMFVFCCYGAALFGLRVKLRTQENIQGSLCDDYVTAACCGLCVLCQLSRELDRCGIN